MSKSMLLLGTFLTLPAAGVIFWMMTPAPSPTDGRDIAREDLPVPRADHGIPAAVMVSVRPLADTSQIVRRSEEDFPELPPMMPSRAPADPAPAASSRFTIAPDAAVLNHALRSNPAAAIERIRVLPPEVVPPDSTAHNAGGITPTAGAVILQVDRSMHDPAAWMEGGGPLGAPQAELKRRIADEFAAEVASAAKHPMSDHRALDDAWKDARARSDSQYRKFFGDDAANRAALNSGRAAVSNQ